MTVQITFEFEETEDGWEVWTVQGSDGVRVSGDTPSNALRNFIDEMESDDGIKLSQSDIQVTADGPILTDDAIERAKKEMDNNEP